jgi:uncharacterized protein (TIGR02284 family)
LAVRALLPLEPRKDISMFGKTDEIETLNTLTATLIDSVTGFRDAADNIESPALKQKFRNWADTRQRAVEELRAEVRRLGGDPRDSGSVLGQTHQRFLDIKAAITGRDEKAIVNEVERGEDYLKGKFESVRNEGNLSAEALAAIERVFVTVRQGHDEVSALKHSMEG